MSDLDFVELLITRGVRVFTVEKVKEIASELSSNDLDVASIIHIIENDCRIWKIIDGVYSFKQISKFDPMTLRDFEHASELVTPSAISHWSALSYYQIVQKNIHLVWLSTPFETTIPKENRSTYFYFQIEPEHFFGIDHVWIGEKKVPITCPEKTILDILSNQIFCEDFNALIALFKNKNYQMNIAKMIDFSQKMDLSTRKRLSVLLEEVY